VIIGAHHHLWHPGGGYDWLVAKLSGLPLAQARPYVETALELFGPGRLMWGSDWPVCTLAATYAQSLRAIQDLVDAPEVFAGTAREVYGVQSRRGVRWR
jgi:L-fuconolactonase